MKPKVKRVQGVSLMQLLTRGDIDVAITFASEINDPGVDVVGQLPREISTPTALVGFISSRAKAPEAAKALLSYLSSSDGAAAYRACGMQPAR
jgi:molybdate transport system substrate-binding protein